MTSRAPSARLMDISRLVSRAGQTLTGIDRVELAYLRAVLNHSIPSFAVSRTALGFVLLDETGIAAFIEAVEQNEWPNADLVSQLNPRLSLPAKRGQTFVRNIAVRKAPVAALSALLRHLPECTAYLNVGHSNLTQRMLAAVKTIPNSQVTVMVHDTIPLDYPQFQRSKIPMDFESRLTRVGRFADLVLCTSNTEAKNVRRHLEVLGNVPEIHVSHIGIDIVVPEPMPDIQPPFFLTVGTIEPRKNHALLLDVWPDLPIGAPKLVICGSRGWNNEEVFARLDSSDDRIVELAGVSDGAVRMMMEQCSGFLFPSFAEGFGLPPVEAAMAGAPLLCSDLPVLREILGSNAVYLDPTDRYQWTKAVTTLIDTQKPQVKQPPVFPSWEAHFNSVFTKT